MRVALDTNILAYAEGVNDGGKRDVALALIRDLPPGAAIIPAQVLGELFNVLTRKAGRSPSEARDAILAWTDVYEVAPSSSEVMMIAADLATDHHLGIWDAVILSTASQSSCRLLLSEDMQDGFTWAGVTVANPFMSTRHPMLESLLSSNDPAE